MLEARKRTAIDGKVWWCVFDTDKMDWSTLIVFRKYKLKRDCQFAINSYNRFESVGIDNKPKSVELFLTD